MAAVHGNNTSFGRQTLSFVPAPIARQGGIHPKAQMIAAPKLGFGNALCGRIQQSQSYVPPPSQSSQNSKNPAQNEVSQVEFWCGLCEDKDGTGIEIFGTSDLHLNALKNHSVFSALPRSAVRYFASDGKSGTKSGTPLTATDSDVSKVTENSTVKSNSDLQSAKSQVMQISQPQQATQSQMMQISQQSIQTPLQLPKLPQSIFRIVFFDPEGLISWSDKGQLVGTSLSNLVQMRTLQTALGENSRFIVCMSDGCRTSVGEHRFRQVFQDTGVRVDKLLDAKDVQMDPVSIDGLTFQQIAIEKLKTNRCAVIHEYLEKCVTTEYHFCIVQTWGGKERFGILDELPVREMAERVIQPKKFAVDAMDVVKFFLEEMER